MRIRRVDILFSVRIHSVRSFVLDWGTPTDLLELFFNFLVSGDVFDQLIFCFVDLSSVSPAVLASAVCKSQYVTLWNGTITASQLEAVFSAIQDWPEIHMKRLNLHGQNLSAIDDATLSGVRRYVTLSF